MAVQLYRRRPVLVPPGFGLWLLFLLWVLASTVDARRRTRRARCPDTVVRSRRLRGVQPRRLRRPRRSILLYVGNLTEEEFPRRRLVRQLGFLFVVVVVGRAARHLRADGSGSPRPSRCCCPTQIAQNGFVQSLVHPASAQVQEVLGFASAPAGGTVRLHEHLGQRPHAAPRLVRAQLDQGRARAGAASSGVAPPRPRGHPGRATRSTAAVGGPGPGRRLLAVRLAARDGSALIGALVSVPWSRAVLVLASPARRRSSKQRLDNPQSNAIRSFTLDRTLEVARGVPGARLRLRRARRWAAATRSPSGADDDCPRCGNPTLGSNGQLWLLLIAQGIVGAVLYVGFFLRSMWAYRRDRNPIGGRRARSRWPCRCSSCSSTTP